MLDRGCMSQASLCVNWLWTVQARLGVPKNLITGLARDWIMLRHERGHMSWFGQMSSEPRTFSTALHSVQLVVRYVGLLGAHLPTVYPSRDSGIAGGKLCNRATTKCAP